VLKPMIKTFFGSTEEQTEEKPSRKTIKIEKRILIVTNLIR